MNLELITKEPKGNRHPTPILFIHGAYAGAWCWNEYFLEHFAAHGYVAHALSLRGHGESDGREKLNTFSVFDYVVDVIRTVHRLDGLPVLVGHSMGGWIVQKYLGVAPAAAGILMAPVPRFGLFPVSVRMLVSHPFLAHKMNLMNMLPKEAWPHLVSPTELHRIFFGKEEPSENEAKYLGLIQGESRKAIMDMFRFPLGNSARTEIPISVTGAASDVIIPPDLVASVARAFGTEAHIFPDMGHAMMLGRGWRQVADHMLAWLAEKKL